MPCKADCRKQVPLPKATNTSQNDVPHLRTLDLFHHQTCKPWRCFKTAKGLHPGKHLLRFGILDPKSFTSFVFCLDILKSDSWSSQLNKTCSSSKIGSHLRIVNHFRPTIERTDRKTNETTSAVGIRMPTQDSQRSRTGFFPRHF